MLSALYLGLGKMVGYKRFARTMAERIGKKPQTPAQGASAELVGGLLIGTAGPSGLPVSTTHIIPSDLAGTMAGSGAGFQSKVATLPATMVLAGGFFWVLAMQ